MTGPTYRITLFALYQIALVAGIALLPLAVAAKQVGLTIPFGRLVRSLERSYAEASAGR